MSSPPPIQFHRKSLSAMEAEQGWTAAEEQLLAETHTGEVEIADTRPDDATEANTIRAELIRHFTLGGCMTMSPRGRGPIR